MSWGRYLLDPDFWEKTPPELAVGVPGVGVMVVFTIYLRQRGSPESKPVGAHTTSPAPQADRDAGRHRLKKTRVFHLRECERTLRV